MSSSLSSCSFDFHSNYSDVPRASSENSTTTTSSLPSRPISGHSAILASSSSSSSCLFLEILPLEVRFIIYSYLVTPTFSSSSSHPQSTLNHRARKGNQHTALASRPSHICRPFSTLPLISSASHNFWPAILRVNRQINIEARSIIYSLITWSLAPIGYQFSFLGGGVLTGLAGDIHSHHRHHFDHYLYHEQQQPRLQSSAGESYYSDGPNVSSNQNQLGTYNHPRSENFSPRFYHSPHLERGPFPELFSQGTADTSSSSLVLLRLSEPYRAGLFRHVKLRIQLDGVVLRADPTFSLRRYCDEVRRNVERVVRVVRGAQGLRTVTVEWVDGTGSEECHVDYTQTEEEFKVARDGLEGSDIENQGKGDWVHKRRILQPLRLFLDPDVPWRTRGSSTKCNCRRCRCFHYSCHNGDSSGPKGPDTVTHPSDHVLSETAGKMIETGSTNISAGIACADQSRQIQCGGHDRDGNCVVDLPRVQMGLIYPGLTGISREFVESEFAKIMAS